MEIQMSFKNAAKNGGKNMKVKAEEIPEEVLDAVRRIAILLIIENKG